MKLNKSQIDKITATSKECFYWDSQLKGLGLRVSPKGRKTFVVQYRHKGRTHRVRIGQVNQVSVHKARKSAQVILGKIANGQNPTILINKFKHSPPLQTVTERFLDDYVSIRLKPKTQMNYKHNIRAFILPAFSQRIITEITHEDVLALHLKMKKTPVQANRTISILSKIFNMCIKWGLLESGKNPCTNVERYKERRKNRFLSQAELGRLWEALDHAIKVNLASHYAISAFRLLILTGCRLGEIRTMKWSYIEGNRITFPDTKTGYKRVPLNQDAMNILSTIVRKPDNEYVICGDVHGRPIVNLQKPWRRIRTLADLEDVRIHDLRHTFASHAVMGGTPLAIVSQLLGHSQISTTMRYAHLADAELAKATERIGGLLGPRVEKTDVPAPLYLRAIR